MSKTRKSLPVPLALKVPEVAKLLGISARHAWKLVLTGEIRSLTFGKSRRVARAEVIRLLKPAIAIQPRPKAKR